MLFVVFILLACTCINQYAPGGFFFSDAPRQKAKQQARKSLLQSFDDRQEENIDTLVGHVMKDVSQKTFEMYLNMLAERKKK